MDTTSTQIIATTILPQKWNDVQMIRRNISRILPSRICSWNNIPMNQILKSDFIPFTILNIWLDDDVAGNLVVTNWY